MITFNQDYYENVVRQNGYVFTKDLEAPLTNLTLDDMKKWLCVYNLSRNVAQNVDPRNTLIISGIGANKEPHIGTLSQILRVIYMQKKGYNAQIILGDLDCYNARGKDMNYVKEIVEKYKKFITRIGFNTTRGTIRNQLDHEEVMKTAFLIAAKVKDSDFIDTKEDLYSYYKEQGIIESEITFSVKQSILLMFADFIHNGFVEQFKNVIVLSGIDEHPYVKKAAEIAKRMVIDMTISGMFSQIIHGFNDQPKMSKSLPDSSIWVTMSQREIANMLLNHENTYNDYNESIVFQLMSSTFMYSEDELLTMSEHCIQRGSEWEKDKIDFSQKLYTLCSAWESS